MAKAGLWPCGAGEPGDLGCGQPSPISRGESLWADEESPGGCPCGARCGDHVPLIP